MSQPSSPNPNDIVELDLTGCQDVIDELRRLDQFTNLRILGLDGCLSLTDLPEKICELQWLRELRMQNCRSVTTLPEAFWKLSSLQSLNLMDCINLKELPPRFAELCSLADLNISHCYGLQELPSGFGSLSSLRNLDISFCESLVDLPATFGNLTSLQTLNLEFCQDLANLPENFSNLGSLERLLLSGCESLEKLPDDFGKLKSLRHLGFRQDRSLASGMETLPESFGKLSCLQNLTLRCPNLETLPQSFGDLKSLIYLDLSGCQALSSLPDSFSKLESLQFLSIQFCSGLETVWNDSAFLSSLIVMNAGDCDLKADAMDRFLELKNLILLYIAGSINLIDRWEQVKNQHHLWLIYERRTPEIDSFEWEAFESVARETRSRLFFHGDCKFVDGDGNGAEDFFPAVGAKLALVMCASPDVPLELMKQKCVQLSSRGFEVVYVALSEESQEDCRQKLACLLPEGGGGGWGWIAGELKCRNLFGFSVVYGEKGREVENLCAFIVTANVMADEKGNKCLGELEMVFPQGDDGRGKGASFDIMYHGLSELISRMMEA